MTTPTNPEQAQQKVRVYAAAKQAGLTSAEALARLSELGHQVRSASATITTDIAALLTTVPEQPTTQVEEPQAEPAEKTTKKPAKKTATKATKKAAKKAAKKAGTRTARKASRSAAAAVTDADAAALPAQDSAAAADDALELELTVTDPAAQTTDLGEIDRTDEIDEDIDDPAEDLDPAVETVSAAAENAEEDVDDDAEDDSDDDDDELDEDDDEDLDAEDADGVTGHDEFGLAEYFKHLDDDFFREFEPPVAPPPPSADEVPPLFVQPDPFAPPAAKPVDKPLSTDRTAGYESDPQDVFDEVTAIKGSTRLEAKRRRRTKTREQSRNRRPILTEAEFLARREAVDRVMVVREKARHDHQGTTTQVGVLEDGMLVEHFVTSETQSTLVGNIYLGRVQNVLPSMEAAFVDIGTGRNAVIYAGEINWRATGVRSRKIEQALKPGDMIVVQVTKDPVGHKGARLSSQVSLAGRYLVYVPGGRSTGISRKLPENERTRLKAILKKVVPDDGGTIIRTAAEGVSEEEIARDVARLHQRWETIQEQAKAGKTASDGKPRALYEEPNMLVKVVRDLFNEDFSKLIIDSDAAYELVTGYLSEVAPELGEKVERFERHNDIDAFLTYRIDEQIQKALQRKVWLPSGGSLVIDRTEAMTVIDVNTGKFTGAGGSLEESVTRNNLEAAEEIVRQLRLRDIGGIVVIDFIDMVLEANQDLVLRRLTEVLGRDRTRHQVSEVTSLGLVQMTRKKLGSGLVETFSQQCRSCSGRGIILQDDPVEHAGVDEDEPRPRRRKKGEKAESQPAEKAREDASSKSGPKPSEHPLMKQMHKHDQPEAEEHDAAAEDQGEQSAPEAEQVAPAATTSDAEGSAAEDGASGGRRLRRRSRRATRSTTPQARQDIPRFTTADDDVDEGVEDDVKAAVAAVRGADTVGDTPQRDREPVQSGAATDDDTNSQRSGRRRGRRRAVRSDQQVPPVERNTAVADEEPAVEQAPAVEPAPAQEQSSDEEQQSGSRRRRRRRSSRRGAEQSGAADAVQSQDDDNSTDDAAPQQAESTGRAERSERLERTERSGGQRRSRSAQRSAPAAASESAQAHGLSPEELATLDAAARKNRRSSTRGLSASDRPATADNSAREVAAPEQVAPAAETSDAAPEETQAAPQSRSRGRRRSSRGRSGDSARQSAPQQDDQSQQDSPQAAQPAAAVAVAKAEQQPAAAQAERPARSRGRRRATLRTDAPAQDQQSDAPAPAPERAAEATPAEAPATPQAAAPARKRGRRRAVRVTQPVEPAQPRPVQEAQPAAVEDKPATAAPRTRGRRRAVRRTTS